jgi:16S rRNA processing protein RimM
MAEGRVQGGGLVARLEGLDERDAAAALRGADIEVERQLLPPPGPGEVYWADLIGCEVLNASGERLGTVQSLFENAGQDVMVVAGERERLIPFVAPQIVRQVDVSGRRVVVDWERDY